MPRWNPTPQDRDELRAYAKACAHGLEVQLDIDDHNVLGVQVKRGGKNARVFDHTTVAATDLAAAKRLVKLALDHILESLKAPGTVHITKRQGPILNQNMTWPHPSLRVGNLRAPSRPLTMGDKASLRSPRQRRPRRLAARTPSL
jgi:hypothetical protein